MQYQQERYIIMSDFNTFEFVVDERAEGKRKLIKFLGRFALLAFIGAFVAFTFIIRMPMLAILPLMLLGLVLYFWKIFNCELEYSMTSGIMTFSRIYGGIKRKKVLELTIKDFRGIAPRTAESDAKLKAQGVSKTSSFDGAGGAGGVAGFASSFFFKFERRVINFTNKNTHNAKIVKSTTC